MDRYTLDMMKKHNPEASLVYRIEAPHAVLKDSRPIEVYVDVDKSYYGVKTFFMLFNQNEFVSNSIIFQHSIPEEAYLDIAKDMVAELLAKSDFEDLDRELKGLCACTEFEGVYKSCDECPQYHSTGDMSCMGAVYSIPTHLNGWECEKKYEKLFGKGTDYYQKYLKSLVDEHIRALNCICFEDKELKKYVKNNIKKRY